MPGLALDESPHAIRRRFSESSDLPLMQPLINLCRESRLQKKDQREPGFSESWHGQHGVIPGKGEDSSISVMDMSRLEVSRIQNSTRGSPMDWAKHGVKIVHSDELDLNTPQTSSMTRAAAITHANTGASKLWAGTMVVQPDAKTGDFIYVPPYVPHQEINASPNEICEAVVVRDGQDPIVVNLDVRTPEPASAGHKGMPFHPER